MSVTNFPARVKLFASSAALSRPKMKSGNLSASLGGGRGVLLRPWRSPLSRFRFQFGLTIHEVTPSSRGRNGPRGHNPTRRNCSLQAVLSDVLGLTKINFNSCLHNDRLPVTLGLPRRWRRSHLSTDGQRAEVAFQVYI